MTDLSELEFRKDFWYRFSDGDYYIEKLSQLPNGNWLMSGFNWELKISDFWVCKHSELQYEFILIKIDALEPYTINSDTGGTSYHVGILSDGTIISETERINGYAKIKGNSIDVQKFNVEPRNRSEKSHWVFLVSYYHKAGCNPDATIAFCKKLDAGEVAVNEKNIYHFLSNLKNCDIIRRSR